MGDAVVGVLQNPSPDRNIDANNLTVNATSVYRQRVEIGSAGTATLTTVSGLASSVTLVAANAARVGLIVRNSGSDTLLIKYGTTASGTSFTDKVSANSTWTMPAPVYNGRLDGIWSGATTNAYITELT